MAADVRPSEDHDRLESLSRRMACSHCGHEEHVMECQALIDLDIVDVHCPCHGIPVPGIHPTVPRSSRFTR